MLYLRSNATASSKVSTLQGNDLRTEVIDGGVLLWLTFYN